MGHCKIREMEDGRWKVEDVRNEKERTPMKTWENIRTKW